MNTATHGFASFPIHARSLPSVAAPAGLPTTQTTRVSGSASSAASAGSSMSPPISSERSRPPTPIA